ncbi:MFS transporter, DHA2 family, multidrug resistance protein [Cohaesibacter sp. ES.047]|uniref:DHA2 family efflux MFS transporter permease subunit n=1 Tax=Cohaesibacter sp. ES.047 TaxID=1798205 RepID=UPI000BB76DCD|nr:DHA2 family efflux MFS transporter permease subunit [Cohaesibacter sp. ES.047]SNY92143.1 MFS transporter, DHA2 family, multidrug resistance protein [Cohaesibacter sp. ES.047]
MSFDDSKSEPLTGARLLIAALAIGTGNFLVVLDSTIANVSTPTIAGSLGVSMSQGTWVITSYAVAEAITVPLTGWLSMKFGAMRTFIFCFFGFALISLYCGMANSLTTLVAGRVLLGLVGGPIMPLSQMLLVRIFPKEKATAASVLWAMTSLIGPIAGPILGGIICDSYGWEWIFFIKVPVALAGGFVVWALLRHQPDPKAKARIDVVGLGLLVVWVGALQILLEEGRNKDWFASPEICILAAVAVIGFLAFLIWELTDDNPIVDLRIFRHRGFTAASITFAAGFGAFFASVVILPLWLQQNMGYTATWAGYATGMMGILAFVSAPIIGKLNDVIDSRIILSTGILGLGAMMVWRMTFNGDVTFLQMAWPTLLTGPFMVMFFVPVTGLALATVEPHEMANAAGLSNFMRTLAGAFATSLVQTGWQNSARVKQNELVNAMPNTDSVIYDMMQQGMSHEAAVGSLTGTVYHQSVLLSTLEMFGIIAVVFMLAAFLPWLAPRVKGGHH